MIDASPQTEMCVSDVAAQSEASADHSFSTKYGFDTDLESEANSEDLFVVPDDSVTVNLCPLIFIQISL